ncbi:DUF4097 family beta strand repeat-containing protein [Thalassotalea sp. PLHSN55]|uniref:DUF4097 family beta strand repeat-containing protein n=1 Tax=Thalassotalea sp. PLHSN55 TaxID=3435888 RepID=UPI003F831DE0
MNIVKNITLGLVMAAVLPVSAGEKIDQSLSASGVSQIEIENVRGDIKVTGGSSDKVTVTGELDDQTEDFIFKQQGSQLLIKVKVPRHLDGNDRGNGSKLDINIPQGIKVIFNGVSTDLSVTNTNSSAEIRTVSGDVKVDQLVDYIELTTVSGDVESKDLSGKINISTVSGEIDDQSSQGRLQLKTVSGSIETSSDANEVFLNTVSGDVEANLAKIDELVVATVSGDVDSQFELNDDGNVKLSSVSGDYKLGLQENVQASFRLSSSAGGSFSNKITHDKAQEAKYGPSAKLNFETGNASSSIRATTVSGDVELYTKK